MRQRVVGHVRQDHGHGARQHLTGPARPATRCASWALLSPARSSGTGTFGPRRADERAVALGRSFFGPLIDRTVELLRGHDEREPAAIRSFLTGVREAAADPSPTDRPGPVHSRRIRAVRHTPVRDRERALAAAPRAAHRPHTVSRDTRPPGNTGFTNGQWPGNRLLTGCRASTAAPRCRSAATPAPAPRPTPKDVARELQG
ncbi:hypothetical protein GCM10010129_82450 [Streptomyces fumigatiscleroticus]|nr:hypothetical protein GCM10010129_82450 [Streptomyces fumigatiscleroticus]